MAVFKKMTVRSLMIGSGAGVSVLVSVVVAWSLFSLNHIDRKLERITKVNVAKVGHTVRLFKSINAGLNAVVGLSCVSDEQEYAAAAQKFTEAISACSVAVHSLAAIEVNERGTSLCVSLTSVLNEVKEEWARSAAIPADSAADRFAVVKDKLGRAETVIDSINEWNMGRIRSRVEQSSAVTHQMAKVSLVWGGLAILCCIAVIMFIIRKITVNITLGMSLAASLSEGDFTRDVRPDSVDEVGRLVGWLNTAGSKLRSMFGTVKTNIMTLTFSIQALSESAQHIMENAERMQRHSKEAVDSADIISNNMSALSDKAGRTYESVNTVSGSVAVISTSLNGIAENCRQEFFLAQEAGDQAKTTGQLMEKLDESARTITRIVDLIGDITKRTNLLALNATIEAASAGEAGKGFAVVANEVKDLARQTAKATDEISQQIKDIQTNTGASVSAVGRIGTAIGKVNDISQTIVRAVDEQTATLAAIAQSMAIMSTNMKEMADNVKDGSVGVVEITQNINHLSSAFSDLGAGVKDMQSSLADMGDLIGVCEIDAKKFKV